MALAEDDSQYLIEIQDGTDAANQEEMMVILDLDGQEMPESVTQAIIHLAQNSSQPISQVRVTKAIKSPAAAGSPDIVETEFNVLNDDGNISSIKVEKDNEKLQQVQEKFLSSNAGNFSQNIFFPSDNIHEDIFQSNSDTQILLPADECIIQQHLLPGSETSGHVLVLREPTASSESVKFEEEVLLDEKNRFDSGAANLNSDTRIIVKDLIQLEEFRTGKLRQSVCPLNSISQTDMDVPDSDETVYLQKSVNLNDEHNCLPVSHTDTSNTKKNAFTCLSNETLNVAAKCSVTQEPQSRNQMVTSGSLEVESVLSNTPLAMSDDKNVSIQNAHIDSNGLKNIPIGKLACAETRQNEIPLRSLDAHNNVSDISATQEVHKISCSFCSFYCENDIEMGRHLKLNHNDKHPYKCSICEKSFAIELSFKIHLLSHGDIVVKKHSKPKTVIDCPHCSESFTTTRRVLRHVCEVHPKLHVYFCNECKISFKSKLELDKHIVSPFHQDKVRKVTLCPVCKVSCLRLTKHMTIKHPNYRPFLCDMCGYSCKTHTKMKIHQLTHLSEKPFQCPHCHKFLKSKVSWSRHVKNHSSEKRFSCAQCNFRSNDSYEYKRHVQRVHSKNMYYDCKFCNLSFVKAYDLKLHAMSEHNSKDTQFCCYCNFSCETRAEMKQHRQTHTGKNPFVCDKCGFSTAFKAHLERHQATHSNLKPFKCPECDYSCKEKVNLKKHMVIHRPEKPFACSLCPHRCKLRSLLNSHIRIVHSSLRPFSCNLCNYTCKTPSNLKKHQWIHQGYKPFACRFCPYVTRETNKLRRHERFKHKAVIEEAHIIQHKKNSQNQEMIESSEHTLGSVEQHHQIRTSVQENSEPSENGFTKGLFRAEASNTADSANEEDISSPTEGTFFSSRVSLARLQGNLSSSDSLAFSMHPSQHQRFIIQFSE